jgi:hypothetical protein
MKASVSPVPDLQPLYPFATLALGLSIGMLILGAVLAPIVIVRMPADYFVRPEAVASRPQRGVTRLVLHALKNVLGVVLILIGIAMLVLPGQGILTLLCGLSLLNFPGKRKLERRLLHIPAVERVIQLIRRKAGRPPLQLDRGPDEHVRGRRRSGFIDKA